MSLIFLPFTPPLSFTQATASRTPVANGLPTSAVMPVMSKMPPTLISCACAAPASAAAASSAIVLIVRFMTPPWPAWVLRCVRRLQSLSVREGVELPVVPDRVPPRGHAVRLEEQEEHDREPEDPGLERREEVDELREGVRELARPHAEHLRQDRDEDRPEDRAEDRAEPADDDHPELVDRDGDGEVLRADDVRVVGDERPRDAHVERRHAEAEQLVLEDVHPHDLGGDVLVTDRDERLARLRAEEVLREEQQEHGDGEDEVEEAPVAVELERPELRRRDGDAVHAPGDPVPVRGGELDDEVRRERRHREVEPLEPQRGDAEDHPGERAREAGERDDEQAREPGPPGSTPPIADTTAAMDQSIAKTCSTETPIESATCCEKAVARIAMPARVY